MHHRRAQLVGVSIICFFMLPAVAQAASVSFSPSSGFYRVGEKFSVNVLVSSADQAMNAASAHISFSRDNLEVVSVSQSGSIIGFWAQQPAFSNESGAVSFEGVVFNGYTGSAGKLVTLNFRARSPGQATLGFNSASVLANDGLGTSISTNVNSADFTIGAVEQKVPALVSPEKIPEGFTFAKNLNLSNENIDIAYLQLCLKNEGFYSGDITGYFGPKTKRAVIDFQEKYFDDILTPWGFTKGTGLVRETTRTKLNEICLIPEEEEVVEEEPEKVFDIDVTLEDITITQGSDPVAIITFRDMGTESVFLNFIYTIVDEFERVMFRDEEVVSAETENVMRKTFKNLGLPSGLYALKIEAQYNSEVVVRAKEKFEVEVIVEIVEEKNILMNIWLWIGLSISLTFINIILLIVLIILLLRRYYTKKKVKKKTDTKNSEKYLTELKRKQERIEAEEKLLKKLEQDVINMKKRLEKDREEIKKRFKE